MFWFHPKKLGPELLDPARADADGVFAVALDGLFASESMFTRRCDGSQVARAALIGRLRRRGFVLVDIQMLMAHTARLGAVEVPQADYLRRLRAALGAIFGEGSPA